LEDKKSFPTTALRSAGVTLRKALDF